MTHKKSTPNSNKTDPVILVAAIILIVIMAACITFLYIRSQSNSHYQNEGAGNSEILSTNVKRIVVGSWDGGSISITPHDGDYIILEETAYDGEKIPENEQLYYRISGNNLEIKSSLPSVSNMFRGSRPKNLVISIPEDIMFDIVLTPKNTDIQINEVTGSYFRAEAVNGSVSVNNCSFESVSLSSAAGGISAKRLVCKELSCRTLNCSAEVFASINGHLKVETSSGSALIETAAFPKSAEISAINGEVNIWLPEGVGFYTETHLNKGKIIYNGWPNAKDNLNYVYKEGDRKFAVKANQSTITMAVIDQ